MTRRGASLLLDAAMLLIFAALMSWRLTGVPVHEWMAVGLIALIVVHLLLHWHWVETRVARVVRGTTARTRVNVLLNAGLFVAMVVAMTSGFVISKVVLPNALSAGVYLKWHGLHDTASTAALVILGLHVALNWDLILGGLRGLRRADRSVVTVKSLGTVSTAIRRLAWIAAAVMLVTAATRAAGALLPATNRVMFVHADGRRELGEAPPEITALDPQLTRPSASRGAVGFAMRLALLGVIAVVGRRVLKVRLV